MLWAKKDLQLEKNLWTAPQFQKYVQEIGFLFKRKFWFWLLCSKERIYSLNLLTTF